MEKMSILSNWTFFFWKMECLLTSSDEYRCAPECHERNENVRLLKNALCNLYTTQLKNAFCNLYTTQLKNALCNLYTTQLKNALCNLYSTQLKNAFCNLYTTQPHHYLEGNEDLM